ncbi:hypothetical protein JCM5353_004656, partial [Sporobolomyces roseus]
NTHKISPESTSTAEAVSASSPSSVPQESVNSTSNSPPASEVQQKTPKLSSFTPGRDNWVTEQLKFYNANASPRSPIVFDLMSESDAYSLIELNEEATLIEVEQKISEVLRVYRERSDVQLDGAVFAICRRFVVESLEDTGLNPRAEGTATYDAEQTIALKNLRVHFNELISDETILYLRSILSSFSFPELPSGLVDPQFVTDWDQFQSVASAILVPTDVEDARKTLGVAKNASYQEDAKMMGTNGMKVVGAILYLSVKNEHSLSTASSLFLDVLGLETSRIISEILERAGVTDTKTRLSLATSMISRNLKNAASKKKLLTRFKVEEGTDKAKVAVVDKKPSSASKPVPSSKVKKPSPPSLKRLLPSSSSSPSTPIPDINNEKSKVGLEAEDGIAHATDRTHSDVAIQTDPILLSPSESPRQPPYPATPSTSSSFVGSQAFAVRRLAEQNVELNAKLKQERMEK